MRGALVASQGKGQNWEVVADEVNIVGASDDSYPCRKRAYSGVPARNRSICVRAQIFWLRLLVVRSRLAFAIHQFFQERGFYYIHTPIITGSDCEGAGELLRVTAIDCKNPPRQASGDIDYARISSVVRLT